MILFRSITVLAILTGGFILPLSFGFGAAADAAGEAEIIQDAPKPTDGPIASKKTDTPEGAPEKKLTMLEEARLKALGINPKYVDVKTIKRMEVFKMATPDKDADILGGTLKVRFQPVYKRLKPIIRSDFSMGYFEDAPHSGDFASLSYGQSLKVPLNIPVGFSVGLLHDTDVIPRSTIARDWIKKENDIGEELLTIEDVTIQKQIEERVRNSISLNLDLKLSDDSFAYFKGYVHKMNRHDLSRAIEYEFAKGDMIEFDGVSGYTENTMLVRRLADRRYENVYQSYITGIFHDSELWENEVQLQYKEYFYRSDSTWDSYFENSELALSYDNADKDVIDLKVHDSENAWDKNQYKLGDLKKNQMDDSSSDIVFNTDSTRTWSLTNGLFKVKAGLKYFSRNFTSFEERKNYTDYNGETQLSLNDVAGEWTVSNVGNTNYNLFDIQDPEKLKTFFQNNESGFNYNEASSRSQSDPANYNVKENVQAGYLMLDRKWTDLRVVVGGRYEKTADEFIGKEVLLDEEGNYLSTTDTKGKRSYAHFFPGIHTIYHINSDLTLFSSWSRALKRPQFSHLAPFKKIVHRSQYISEGNPTLAPTIYDNMLIALDYNFSSDGFIKMEYLLRDYSDIVVKRRFILEEGLFEGYKKDTWLNVGKANLERLEIRLFHGLGFIGNLLKDIALEVRYTRNDSYTNLREGEKDPLVNKPKNNLSGSLKYAKNAIEVKARVNYRDAYLSQIGADTDRDHYYDEKSTYDVSFEYKVDDKLTGVIEVENLTNEATQSYMGSTDHPMDYRNNGRYWKAGIRYRY